MSNALDPARWFNQSPRWLRFTALGVAISFLLFCVATAYFVAQYFVCIGECSSNTPPLALLAVSAFFGLIPAVGTGAIGYLILKGLWDDAKMQEDESSPGASEPTPDGETAA
jgi:hypothetical protein